MTDSLYTALPGGSIRVLHLQGLCTLDHPDGSIKDFAVKCRLEIISLSDVQSGRASYKALSYVWGTGSQYFRRHVVCNEQVVPVTVNLFNALQQISSDKSEPVWVDALCINQNDEEETISQVRKMGDIFRLASEVSVWLGTGGDDPDNNMGEFWKQASSHTSRADMEDDVYRAGKWYLEDCQWLQRCWTFQEIVVARTARVLCGSYSIRWDDLVQLTSQDTEEPAPKLQAIEEIRERFRLLSTGQNGASSSQRSNVDGFRLVDLIQASDNRTCLLPEDRIFSLLGLYKNDYLRPDSSWTPRTVSSRAAIIITQELNSLAVFNVLTMWTTSTDVFKMPSRHLQDEPGREHDYDIAHYGVPLEMFHTHHFRPRSWIPDFRGRLAENTWDPASAWFSTHEVWWPYSMEKHVQASLEDDDLIVTGAILGQLDLLTKQVTENPIWQPRHGFIEFPPCVAPETLAELIDKDPGRPWLSPTIPRPVSSADGKTYDPGLLYLSMVSHSGRSCACFQQGPFDGCQMDPQVSDFFPQHHGQSEVRWLSDKGGSEEWPPFKDGRGHYWLCAVWGYAHPIVICPEQTQRISARSLSCAISSRLKGKLASKLRHPGQWQEPDFNLSRMNWMPIQLRLLGHVSREAL